MGTWWPVVALCIAGATSAGCVKRDDGGLSQGEAKSAGDALGNGIEDAAATYGPMKASAADTTCIVLSGDQADPDGDSIPLDARLTYDCTTQALGYTGRLTGTQDVMDDQPAAAAWAFTGSADLHASLTGPGGGSITSDWDGSLVGTQASVIGPYALRRTLDVVTVFMGGGDAGPRLTSTVTEDNDWTVTFTPQATWTPGGVVVTGSLAATGSWNVDVDGKSFEATLSTPTPLVVTPGCETLITAGVAVGTYPIEGGSGTITVTWTGCGARTVAQAENL